MKFDIIFISFRESNGDKNWIHLKSRFPRAKRVHGVQGIAQAHQMAAEISETEFFFVVDGDNRVKANFQFSTPSNLKLNKETIYVWRCHNPVNDLIYGFGAIKLYNKDLMKSRYPDQYVDLATNVSEKYQIVHEVASETLFFLTPEEAWRGAFRECVKLASRVIDRQKENETSERLNTWCKVVKNYENSNWVLQGARQGKEFGEKNANVLYKINDYQWLKQRFEENVEKSF